MNILLILAGALSLSLILGANAQEDAQSQEDKLVTDLLVNKVSRTSRIARPVSDATGNVTVTLGLSLIHMESLKNQRSIELGVWLNIMWEDPRLKWNPGDFGGLSSVTLPEDLVWLPDIRAFSAMGYQPDKETASRVVLFSSGSVIYVLPARIRSRCQRAENGSLTCKMVLGSWVFNGRQVDLLLSDSQPFDLSDFEADDDWEVVSADASRRVNHYACCPEPYISVEYVLTLKPKEEPESVGTPPTPC